MSKKHTDRWSETLSTMSLSLTPQGFWLTTWAADSQTGSTRFTYEMLSTLKMSEQWVEEIEVEALKIKSKPF